MIDCAGEKLQHHKEFSLFIRSMKYHPLMKGVVE